MYYLPINDELSLKGKEYLPINLYLHISFFFQLFVSIYYSDKKAPPIIFSRVKG